MVVGELGGPGQVDGRPSKVSSAAPSAHLRHLLASSADAGQAGARHRLVGADDHAAARPRVERLQHRHGHHGRAVGVGHDALGDARRARAALTSGTTSGTSGSIRHAEELSMTIAPAAATAGASSREAAPPAENRAMSRPAKSAVAASSTVISLPRHGDRAAGRAGRGEEPQLVDREAPLGEHRAHDAADLAGGAEDADVHGAKATGDSRVGSCHGPAGSVLGLVELEGGVQGLHGLLRPRPARTTHEMRMAEVEIISMLIPLSASVSNIVAATPGFDFMPAPTRLTRAMSASVPTPRGAHSSARAGGRPPRPRRGPPWGR